MKTAELTRRPGFKSAGATNKPADGDNELTSQELQDLVQKAVAEALKSQKGLSADDIKSLTESVITGIKAKEDAAKAASTAAAGSTGGQDTKGLSADDIKSLTEKVTASVMDNVRREKKNLFSGEQENKGTETRPQIEIPVGLTKGNLPVAFKQLVNLVLKNPDPNFGIDSADVKKAADAGERQYQSIKAMGFSPRSLEGVKALTAGTSGSGKDFLAVDLSSMLQQRLYLESKLVAALALNEIDMPTNPYLLPLSQTRPSFKLGAENTATTATDPATAQITLTTQKLIGQTNLSYELDEDSLIPILPWLTDQLGKAAAEALESSMINGDTTGTHQDSDTNSITGAPEKAWKGFRFYALAQSALKKDFSVGGVTDANLRSLKKAMGKWGVNPANLLLICGVNGQTDLEGMPEVSTWDKFQDSATIITGTLPRWRNIPIVTSIFCRENLNASGVYDGTTTTKGSVILVNIKEWFLGRRREFMVETWKDVQKQQTVVVASFRRSFVPKEAPSSTILTTAIGYNYNA